MRVVTIVTLLITPRVTTHEPPSKAHKQGGSATLVLSSASWSKLAGVPTKPLAQGLGVIWEFPKIGDPNIVP